MITYQKVVWQVPEEYQDVVIATLVELGSEGAEIGSDIAGNATVTIYQDQAQDDWQTKIENYILAMEVLNERGLQFKSDPIVQESLDSSVFENEWKNYYHASRITNRFTVVPSWENYQPEQAQEKLIVMDPEQAFGTGTHPTTTLMIQALESVVRGGEKTIDVGTGSGVLAVAAKHLGVGPLLATDIDDTAVQTAKENLNLNPVAQDVQVIVSDLMADVNDDWSGADLIMANILADVILSLIPQVYPRLKPNGYFLVSGIYDDVKESIKLALKEAGFLLVQEMQQDTWHAFIAKKV